jgi:hypothetical protein
MFVGTRFAILLFAAGVLAACSSAPPDSGSTLGPSPEQMRTALKTMLKDHPDVAIPEFRNSLDYDPAVVRQGVVYIGSWNCDPKAMWFEAAFTASNVSFFEVSGSFQTDARGEWLAVLRHVKATEKRDVSGYWRASDLDVH